MRWGSLHCGCGPTGSAGAVSVRSGFFSGSSAPAATATARYTEYDPEWVPMALRWAGLVTVAMIGPRSIGSAAPQRMGIGCGPCRPGWEVREIFAGLARRGGAGTDMGFSSGHPGCVGLELPLGGDLLPAAPELDRRSGGGGTVAELRFLPAAEGERLAGDGDADVDAHHAAGGPLAHQPGHRAAGGEHAGGVAVRALRLDRQRLLEVGGADDREHRAEQLG